jgi:hypothetical protein
MMWFRGPDTTKFASRLSPWIFNLVALSLNPSGAVGGLRYEFIGRGNSAVSWRVTEVRDVDNKNLAQGKIGDRILVRDQGLRWVDHRADPRS